MMRSALRFFLVAFLLPIAAARATDFNWPNHGTISFEVPADWRFVGKLAGDVGFVFKGTPKSAVAVVLRITVLDIPADKPVPATDLKDQLKAVVEPYLADSVEKKFLPVALNPAQGTGWYAQITDASLVGKPPVADNFKMMRNALLAPDSRLRVIASMQFDDANAPEVAAMLRLVQSVHFNRSATPAVAEAAVKRVGNSYEFTVPESKVVLKIPANGLQPLNDRMGGSSDSPRYFKLGGHSLDLVVSGWMEPAAKFHSTKELWASDSAAMVKGGVPAPAHVAFTTRNGWEIVTYDISVGKASQQANLRAERVQDGTWLDLHLSMTSDEPLEARQKKILVELDGFKVESK